jgi:predicted KAP-like P-loop ATPase
MAVKSDTPIHEADDDLLNRAGHARRFARQVLAFDLSDGLVVGVLGPWGSGKTSFVNLMRSELSAIGAPILDFNPWMFSGAQQLVDSFFAEMASQLKIRPGMAEIGKNLEDYGETVGGLGWLPLVGTWIDRGRVATKVVGKVLQGRKQGAGAQRAKLASKLSSLKRPIVVILDDIDRLTTPEIRDIFKLVRLTASFPNIVYIVSFDRGRVETALREEGISGRDYLEKILQLTVDLPRIPDQYINKLAFEALNDALENVPMTVPFDSDAWLDVFMEVIRPLIRNMRDVRRYAAAIRVTALDLAGEIQLVDVLALDAIRLFLPDTFAALATKVEALTTTPNPFSTGTGNYEQRRSQEYKVQVDSLLASAGDKSEVVRALIRRCFPAAQRHIDESVFGSDWREQWRVGRRVAHSDPSWVIWLSALSFRGSGLRESS